ncbi:MAG: DUF1559 domain-containing protein [Pirellulales bacterium]
MSRRRGFTLVELLVVIAIIGILIALLLPAVQAAREAARRTECLNHLKQLTLGMIMHQDQYKYYPSGGWGFRWTGDPDRGRGKTQPGGWAYQILPFIEQQAIYNLGAGTSLAQKKQGSAQRIMTPLSVFHCPTRRKAILYPNATGSWKPAPLISDPVDRVARSDYAANAGTLASLVSFSAGPNTYAEGDSTFIWPSLQNFNGICANRSEVSQRDLLDGTTNTYFLGERYLSADAYETGFDPGDNEGIYSGDDQDVVRFVGPEHEPAQDRLGLIISRTFGSAHTGRFHASMGDGSVRGISYAIETTVHERLGNREDGQPIDAKSLE